MEEKDHMITHNHHQVPKEPETKKRRPWVYIFMTVIATCATLLVLAIIVNEIRRQASRSVVSGPEQHAYESQFNVDCKLLLDKVRAGKVEARYVAKQLRTMNQEYAELVADGVEAFDELKTRATQRKEAEYRELRGEVTVFGNVLKQLRSMGRLEKDSLYVAYVARDLMVYVFKNRDVFSIHLADLYLSSSDREEMRAFYQDVFSVYDYLKKVYEKHYSRNNFYQDTGNFDLLAVGLYAKAVDATEGIINDGAKIDEIISKVSSESFKFGGQRTEWYNWLKNDIGKVRDDVNRQKVKTNPPDFVG